jgi:hypothetical protein
MQRLEVSGAVRHIYMTLGGKGLTFNNCTLCPHCIYVLCKSDLCHLQHKLIGFITEMKSVYSAVRTGPLNKAACAPSLKG